jgi:hypothetical protein
VATAHACDTACNRRRITHTNQVKYAPNTCTRCPADVHGHESVYACIHDQFKKPCCRCAVNCAEDAKAVMPYDLNDVDQLDLHPAYGTPAKTVKQQAPFWKRLLWEGGRPFDAFLTIVSAQVGLLHRSRSLPCRVTISPPQTSSPSPNGADTGMTTAEGNYLL